MQFRTELTPRELGCGITHSDALLFMGSCFTEHIAASMQRYQFDMLANSHGILFHPIPLAKAVDDLIECKKYTSSDLIQSNENWVSLHHHGKFSSTVAETSLLAINTSIEEGHAFLKKASALIVTLGTAIGYSFKANNQIAANCHKLNADLFTKKRSSIPEMCNAWKNTIQNLLAFNPDIKLIFTVSPVRHLRDGFEENQKSKAALLLLVEEIIAAFPHQCSYFPSYEIMMDDLREYRFYEADMIHPNAQAIEYIKQRFFDAALSPSAKEKCALIEPHLKKMEHRSIHETIEQKERRIIEAQDAIRQILLK